MSNKEANIVLQKQVGKVLKNLREAKGLTLDDAAGLRLTAPSISKLEGGKTGVSLENFSTILQNMNITMYDFQVAFNQAEAESGRPLFESKVSKAYEAKDTIKLKALLSELEDQMKRQPDKRKLSIDRAGLKILIARLDASDRVAETEISYLADYLYGVKEWGAYEMRLLGLCLPLLDVTTLDRLAQHLIDPSQINFDLHYTKRLFTQTLIHLIDHFVKVRQFTLAEKYISYLEERRLSDFLMYEKLHIIYEKARIAYEGGDRTALGIMKDCQWALDFCGCVKSAQLIAAEIAELDK